MLHLARCQRSAKEPGDQRIESPTDDVDRVETDAGRSFRVARGGQMNGAHPHSWGTPRLAVRLAVALACASLVMVAAATPGRASTAGTVKVFFGQGDQLVARERPGTTVQDALAALIAGPTSAERATGTRTYVPPATRVRSVAIAADVATVDLGEGFMTGPNTESTLARLDQVVSTVTAVPGVRAVKVLIKGGTPLGLFPGVDATVALTKEALATPNAPATTTPLEPTSPASAATLALQQQLVALGYLDAANADGVAGPATQTGIVAFQKWQRLPRTGLADAATLAALPGADRPTPVGAGIAGRWFEVIVDRQLLLAIDGNRVVRAIAVSTGKASTPTILGTFKVYAKIPRWWSVPFRDWLLLALPFSGGFAIHQYPEVPTFAASHGCVRVTQYDEPWVYAFASVGTPVRVIAKST
jgi:N-acetylmuramoyl-L-alanine amidase